MRKLVLGILAVVCLDIGFVYYTSKGLQTDLAVNKTPGQQAVTAANPANVSGPSDAKKASDTADVAAVKARPENVSGNRETARMLSQRRTASVKVRSRIRERIPADRNQPLFTPVVFYVPRHSAIVLKQAVPIKNTRNLKPAAEKRFVKYTPKRENRSLVARVWPVVKKPYEWVKALGSKFN